MFTTGEAQLRNAFRDAATTFRRYLTTVDGNVVADANVRLRSTSTTWSPSCRRHSSRLDWAPAAPAAPWPLRQTWDGDGAMLVYAVTKRAQASGGTSVVTDEEFLQIQRIASYGAETIEAVLTVPAIWTTKQLLMLLSTRRTGGGPPSRNSQPAEEAQMPFTANRISGRVVAWPDVAGVLAAFTDGRSDPFHRRRYRENGWPPWRRDERQVPLRKLSVFACTVVVQAGGVDEACAPDHRDLEASGHSPEVRRRTGVTCRWGGR